MLTAVDVYKKIAPKLGDEEATAIITFIEDSIQRGAATKADLQEIAREIETNLRNEIKQLDIKIDTVETNLRNEISGIRNEISGIRNEISGIRNEISGIRNEISELRRLLIKYILPLSALIGSVVGAIISILLR
ncbi:MAG: hypothetical protein AB1480_02985 [Nitrospirota bacterium]